MYIYIYIYIYIYTLLSTGPKENNTTAKFQIPKKAVVFSCI